MGTLRRSIRALQGFDTEAQPHVSASSRGSRATAAKRLGAAWSWGSSRGATSAPALFLSPRAGGEGTSQARGAEGSAGTRAEQGYGTEWIPTAPSVAWGVLWAGGHVQAEQGGVRARLVRAPAMGVRA